jgi:hypothetical protein
VDKWGLGDEERDHSYWFSIPASGTRLFVACRPAITPVLLGRSKHKCVRCAKKSHTYGGEIEGERRLNLLYLPGEAEHNCNPQIDGHNDNFLDKKNSFSKRIPCLISCVQHLNHQKGQTSQYLGRIVLPA